MVIKFETTPMITIGNMNDAMVIIPISLKGDLKTDFIDLSIVDSFKSRNEKNP